MSKHRQLIITLAHGEGDKKKKSTACKPDSMSEVIVKVTSETWENTIDSSRGKYHRLRKP